jgi:hypothetical protein
LKIDSKRIPKSKLIRLEPVIEIVKASIWTGKLSDEKPVSIMLIAEQESAKTECLKFFRGTTTLKYLSDLTSKGIGPFKGDIQSGKIRHLVILDLVRILSHGKGVSERTIQNLASIMEEGESETSDAGGQSSWDNFPKIGCLMAITPKFWKSKRGRWRETGFLTRFVPITFSYTQETVKLIHVSIAKGMKLPLPEPERLPEFPCQIQLNSKYAATLSQRAEDLGTRMKTYGFRYHRVLRALAKAQARIEGKGEVNSNHVGKVLAWSEFFTEKSIEI